CAGVRFDRQYQDRVVAAVCARREGTVAGVGDAGAAIIDRGYKEVILWDDTFVRYNEPHIGIAAVEILEALGVHVLLAHRRKCCGRPAFSQGNLDTAAKFGEHNINLLSSLQNASPTRTSNP